MLNEERIKLMTKMAIYEEKEGKKMVSIASYFRGDYISLQIIKAAISATICYVLIVGVYIYYNFESLLSDVYKLDLWAVGKSALKGYLFIVFIYAVIAFVLYTYRYNKAKYSLKQYFYNLKKLNDLYNEEGRR